MTISEFRFYQLVQVPVPPRDGDPSSARRNAFGVLSSALGAAHANLLATADGAALAAAWIRPPQQATMQLLLGGRPDFPPATGSTPDDGESGTRRILFPPGAVAIDLPPKQVSEAFDAFSFWVPCAVRADALWFAISPRDVVAARRHTFDRYAVHLGVPFAFLVLARPLRAQELTSELADLVNAIGPLTRVDVGEAKRIELERAQSRYRELSRAQEGGAWSTRVLVGGTSANAAASSAAVLCSAAELDGLPYVLAPAGEPRALPELIDAVDSDRDGISGVATGTELLTALIRPPEREVPGVRLVEPRTFDVTPELVAEGEVECGDVLDEAGAPVGRLTLSRAMLNRHTFVCGATGSGKSMTVRHLLAEASRIGLPWLVIEPAKAEYAVMSRRLAELGAEVVVIRPGDPEQPPAGFNPLEPAPGFPLQTHVDLLRALFLAAFESHEPFPQILATALGRCYEDLGWDLALGRPVNPAQDLPYPTLGDLQRVAATVVAEIGYGPEVAADVHGFIKVRLNSLRLGTTGRVFEGGHVLDFQRLRERNVVLEIEDVGDDMDKAFLMGAVLMRLTEHLRVRSKDVVEHGLTHLLVIEEAHRLLRRPDSGTTGPAAHAVEMFASLLAEVRAYGEGIIIAEQIPSKLIVDVIKNTAVKIVHRLPAHDDRDTVGATINLDPVQSRHLVSLVPGQGAVFTGGMDRPLLVRMPDGRAAESSAAGVLTPVSGLVKRRSTTCGTECLAEACTLRDMRAAQHLLATQPWLVVWAELTVLAHLTGCTTPTPDHTWLSMLRNVGAPTRVLDCALSHAVDAAVAARVGLLQQKVQPEQLAEHCLHAIREGVAGEPCEKVCAADSLMFLARQYRWLQPLVALQTGDTDDPDDPAHPDTSLWEERLGVPIPGTTRAEQETVLAARWDAALADQSARNAVTFGTRRPSRLEEAVGGLATNPAWTALVAQALTPFGDCVWPLNHLIPPDSQLDLSTGARADKSAGHNEALPADDRWETDQDAALTDDLMAEEVV